MKKNKLVIIGFLGDVQCYLNVSRTEAIERWLAADGNTDGTVMEFEFDDEFGAYDVWPLNGETVVRKSLTNIRGSNLG